MHSLEAKGDMLAPTDDGDDDFQLQDKGISSYPSHDQMINIHTVCRWMQTIERILY